MKRILVFLMAVLLVVPFLVSCSSNNEGNTGDTNALSNEDSNASVDTALTEANSGDGRENTPDTLPDNLDFDGKTLRIVGREWDYFPEMYRDELYSEDENGEIVNDAVYHRNKSVEERFNMNFEYSFINQSVFNTTIRNSVNSGSNDYDLIAGFAYYIPPLSLEGLFYNWHNMPHIDLSQPWWLDDCTNELTIDGKLYFVTGDLSLALVKSLYVYYFNKQMAQEFSLPDMYKLVTDGKWTFEKFAEISKSIIVDLNGDGTYDTNDRYGYVAWQFANVDGYFGAFDQPITAKNAEGFPELVVNTERTSNIIDMVRDLMYNSGLIYYEKSDKDTVVPNMFMNGQNLFFYSGLYESGTTFRAMEGDFGILPPPKYDETQKEYKTVAHDIYSLFCVPVTCTQRELVGAAVEALAAESYRKVTPAYFETALKVKYSRDEETSQMLDIVLKGATFNFGVVYSGSIDNVGYIMRDLLLFNDRNKSFAAYWEKREARFENALGNLIDKFLSLSGE